ncbi:MAG TPA: hypothetical protein VFI09_02715 [Solirubrobacterales bacterium]|nr:hypothetical protein [Solirubrobacterales bacterium]
MRRTGIPHLFRAAGAGRGLWALAALTLLSGAAMLPALRTMAGHGASVIAFESAGDIARSQKILAEWGVAGKSAMWWQLALDTPFLVGYGLFLAGACTAVARRAHADGRPRLERTAAALAWFGPLAAAADLLQNVSLALVLGGNVEQPWPRISAVAGSLTTSFALVAAAFALGGTIATRGAAHGQVP